MSHLLRALAVCLVVTILYTVGCSKATDTATNLTIAGTLSTTSRDGAQDSIEGAQLRTTYTLRCVTLSGTPVSAQGDVDDTTKKFSLTLATSGAPIGCFVLSGTTVIASIAFKGATTGINGQTTNQGSYVAGSGGNLDFGTVTLNLSTGTATVDSAKITGSATGGTVAGTFVDPTGTWNINSCIDASTNTNCSRDGGVPSSVYFHRFGPVSDTTGGTHYGFSVWQSQTAYSGCGSKEGVNLPSGWTTSDATVTGAMTLDTFDTTFVKYSANSFGGTTSCNFPYTSGMKCSDITANTGNWGNGGVFNFSAADCRAMCAASVSSEKVTGSCPVRQQGDWTKQQAATGQNQLSTCTATGCGAGAAAGFITLENNPANRFISNEMIILGSTGTVYDSQTRHQSACVKATSGATNCTQINCDVTQNTSFTLSENSGTSATITLVQQSTAVGTGGTPTSACYDKTKIDNYVASQAGKQQTQLLTVTKASR